MDKPKPTRLETLMKLDMLKRLTDQTECAPYRKKQELKRQARRHRLERFIGRWRDEDWWHDDW